MANEKKHFIKSFEIKHFRGLDFHIENEEQKITLDENTQWVFITGENGFGKTSVLQALAAGLSGKKIKLDGNIIDLSEEINLKIELQNTTRIYNGKVGKQPFREICAYGSARLIPAPDNKLVSNPIFSLFISKSYLKNIEITLSLWEAEKESDKESKNRLDSTKEVLIELLNIADIKINKGNVTYIDKDKEGNLYKEISFDQLAAGYKNIINFVGDMIIRLFDTQPKVSDIKQLKGIVIIDEFDLHLHPKWQRRLPSILTKYFPNVQFIVSTHSPIPLLGAPENSAFLKVTRNTDEGIKVHKLDIDIRKMLPSAILSSPIFDMETIYHQDYDQKPNFSNLSTDSYKEIEESESLIKKLNGSVEELKSIIGNDFFKS